MVIYRLEVYGCGQAVPYVYDFATRGIALGQFRQSCNILNRVVQLIAIDGKRARIMERWAWGMPTPDLEA